MTFTTSKLTELPLRSSLSLTTHHHHYHFHHHYQFLLFSSSTQKPTPFQNLKTHCSSSSNSSLPTNRNPKLNNLNQSPTPSSWLSKWPAPHNPSPHKQNPSRQTSTQFGNDQKEEIHFLNQDKGQNAIERIVLRLRNLGLTDSDNEQEEKEGEFGSEATNSWRALTGEERLGDLLEREWVRPDTIFSNAPDDDDDDDEEDDLVLPWEREDDERELRNVRDVRDGEIGKEKKRRVRAPTLAELTIEDEELRRLRRNAMFVRERISIPKAGLTKEILEKIHDKWRKGELVRLKFHEVLAHDMKTAHELVEVAF